MKKFLLIFVVIILILVLYPSFLFWQAVGETRHIDGTHYVTIESNDSLKETADKMVKENIILASQKKSFIFYSLIARQSKKIQPGKHYFGPDYTIADVVKGITKKPIEEIKITIPEGWSVKQIAEKLDQEEIIKKDILQNYSKDKEGYLFPDTYYFTKNTPPEDIVKKMTDNFTERTKELDINNQTVIIASLIEREAKFDEDRAKVSAVIYNRLEKNMRLEFDSTVQYSIGSWDEITRHDLLTDSKYNTYINFNLPPTPICNPGLKSIEAALSPAITNDLYFINSSDGKAYFAETKAEHEKNIKNYLK